MAKLLSLTNLSSAFRTGSTALRHGLGWQDGPDADPDGPAVRLLDDPNDPRGPHVARDPAAGGPDPDAADSLLGNHLDDAALLHDALRTQGTGARRGLGRGRFRDPRDATQPREPRDAREPRGDARPHIHPLASVDPKAEIGEGTVVGPFCVVGPDVVIGRNCRLTNNVTLVGHTSVGDHNLFHPGSVIGAEPQDKKYRGEPTRTEIGNYNCFREHVTVHAGTVQGGGVTTVGNQNLFMVGCHLGHDARWGSQTIVANQVMIAGHVVCQDGVALMGGAAVHHFTTLGAHSYVAGYARVTMDVPPFVKVQDDNTVRGLNRVGLERRGFPGPEITALERAVRQLFNRKPGVPFSRVLADLERAPEAEGVRQLLAFLRRRDKGVHGRYLEALRTD